MFIFYKFEYFPLTKTNLISFFDIIFLGKKLIVERMMNRLFLQKTPGRMEDVIHEKMGLFHFMFRVVNGVFNEWKK
jgi:hypothetical protein